MPEGNFEKFPWVIPSINCTYNNRILAINVSFVRRLMKTAKGKPRSFIIVLARPK